MFELTDHGRPSRVWMGKGQCLLMARSEPANGSCAIMTANTNGHLMWRPDELERPLVPGKIEYRRRGDRGWAGGMASSTMDMSLSKLPEIVKDREAWRPAVHGAAKSQSWLRDWETVSVEYFLRPARLLVPVCVQAVACNSLETLRTTAHQAPLSMQFIPGKDTREGCHFLLQGIFLAQGLNPHPCIPCIGGWILYH